MTYQVLARKWRPKSFASLVGQEHVVRALTHALDGGRLHHAYMFTGTRGVGKTTLSRIFAKALNCETGVTSTPCGVCRACREIDEGRFVDYVEMDAASNRGVDEMAALLERAVYAPVDARFKVYMIDEVHMLTNHAFNAMLKTLEEPPSHVKFILATTDPQKIPVTVLSRCLQFNLKQMPAGHIVSHLEHILGEEQIPFESQALRLLSRAADGSMRDALSLTDQAIAYSANQVTEEAVRGMLGALDQSYLIRLLEALAAGDGEGVLSVADEMALRSLSFSTALQDLAGLLHRIAWAQFAPASVLDEWPEAEDVRRFAEALSAEQVQLFYQIAAVGRSELGLAPDEYAGFTMTLLRMLAFEPAGGPGGGGGVVVNGPSSGADVARKPVASVAVAGSRALASSGARGITTTVSSTPTPAQSSSSRESAAMVDVFAPTAGTTRSAAARVDSPGSVDAGVGENAVLKHPNAAGGAAASESAMPAQVSQSEPKSRNSPASAESGAPEGAMFERPDAAAQTSPGAPKFQNAAASAGTSTPASTATQNGATPAHPNVASHEELAPWDDAVPSTGATNTSAQNESRALEGAASNPDAAAWAEPPTTESSESLEAAASARDDDTSRVVTRNVMATDFDAASEQQSPDVSPSPVAAAARQAATDSARDTPTPADQPRAATGASAALDVLRSAGMRVSSDRGMRGAPPVPKPVAASPKRAAPAVQVPTPRRAPVAAAETTHKPATEATPERSASFAVPPWEDMPPDDFMPASSEEAYFMPSDDNFVPAFDSGPDDLQFNAAPAKATPTPDPRPLPAAVPLDAIGVAGDWPSLAVDLPLKGIAYQLAFNSELTACDAASIALSVPVPQYAEAAQVAKLKAALAEKLGRALEVNVTVGPARRTAAAVDAAARAKRQQEAEQEITQDPFVQSLIRDFGASIVQGSIKPLAAGLRPE